MHQYTLRNGLNIKYYSMPNTHSIAIGLYIKAGSRYETPQNNGITHFLEHLHFRRLADWSQEELYYNMESIGSTLRAATYKEWLRYYMQIRPIYLNKCVEIFKRLLSPCIWEQVEFDKEKTVVLNQIYERDSYNNIKPYVSSVLWNDCSLAYPIMGTEDIISKMSLSEVVEYKNEIFTAENIIVFVTGCVTDENIKTINSALSEVLLSPKNKALKFTTINHNFAKRKPDVDFILVAAWDWLEVNLSFDIDFSYITIEEIELLNCMLGDGVGSRLQISIREDKGFSSNICSYIEWYEDVAAMHIELLVHKKQFYDCLREIVITINKMKNEISQRDFDISLPFFTENKQFLLDSPEELNYEYARSISVIEKLINVNSLYEAITPNRIMECAKNVFRSNNACLVVLGDTRKITQKASRELVKILDV